MIAGHHHHMDGRDFAQTVHRPDQQLAAAQKGLLITQRLVLRSTRSRRPAQLVRVKKVVATYHQDFFRRQRRRFLEQILQRGDEHALRNVSVIGPPALHGAAVLAGVMIHDRNFQETFVSRTAGNAGADRSRLLKFFQHSVHELLQRLFGRLAPQPEFDLKQRLRQNSPRHRIFHSDFPFVDLLPLNFPHCGVGLGVRQQFLHRADARTPVAQSLVVALAANPQFCPVSRSLWLCCRHRGDSGTAALKALSSQPAR